MVRPATFYYRGEGEVNPSPFWRKVIWWGRILANVDYGCEKVYLSGQMLAEAVVLTEVASKDMLERAGVPVVVTRLAETREKAISLSEDMGYPVVLKVTSPGIAHKSDCGGVKLNLRDAQQVGQAYDDIMASASRVHPESKIEGVSVQPMVSSGVEVIIGMSRDAQFGPVIMFGIGGVLVELLEDVVFRVVPVTETDAMEMIRDIRAYPVLEGYRGGKRADTGALAHVIVGVSRFVEQHPQVTEMDLNPVLVDDHRAVVVDARITWEDAREEY